MTDRETWQWQEPGSAWKGAGLYHITLTVGSRLPLLGSLVVPDDDPTKASVQRTALGDALVDCLLSIQSHHPEVKVLHFCLMPDHLHAVLYVQRRMTTGIGATVRGFWQASKKLEGLLLFLRMLFVRNQRRRPRIPFGENSKKTPTSTG